MSELIQTLLRKNCLFGRRFEKPLVLHGTIGESFGVGLLLVRSFRGLET